MIKLFFLNNIIDLYKHYIGDQTMHPMLNVAIQAIKKAGDFIIDKYELINRKNNFSSLDNIKLYIYRIEIESKYIIKTIIKKFYPSHIIDIDEKNFIHKKKSNHIYWIIKSVDSNTNFIKQFPFFALSIAVQYQENIEIGVIYDPIHNELFSACRGKGAQCNGYRIRLEYNYKLVKNLNKVILAISCLHYQNKMIVIDMLYELNKKYVLVDFRQTGSIFLDLVYIAIGRIDGCLIISLKQTQKLASAILIIKESGGFITDFKGNEIYHSKISGNIIAGNVKIVKKILTIIKSYKNGIFYK